MTIQEAKCGKMKVFWKNHYSILPDSYKKWLLSQDDKFRNDKLVNELLLRFHNKPLRHADLKRIHCDSQETKPCHVENDTKPLIEGFIISSQYWLNICIYTVILIRTSQKSKTRVFYLTFHNNDFAFLLDRYKVFSLSKNNFLDNFSFIAN